MHQAAYQAQRIASFIHRVLRELRVKLRSGSMTQTVEKPEIIRDLIRRYIKQTLENDDVV